MISYLFWLLPLTVLYILLTGNLEPLNWVAGFMLAVGVTLLLRPERSQVNVNRLPRMTWTLMKFLLVLLYDLIESGLQVTRLVLQRQPAIQQGIIAIPDGTREEWITVASAEAITLTPGELVVEIGDDGTLFTHTLDVDSSLAKAEIAQEGRVRQLEELST